ncbi:MAG: hypothetical protein ABSG94_05290 [Brevinematales bacterium]
MTFAPFSRANWTAKSPTPPAAPWTTTVCPAFTPASSTVCHAVRDPVGRAAANSKERPSGFKATSLSDARAYSA